jgi:hypothetical protein
MVTKGRYGIFFLASIEKKNTQKKLKKFKKSSYRKNKKIKKN